MSEITYTKDYSNTYVFWFNENKSTIQLVVYSNSEFRFRDKSDVCEITLEKSETLREAHLVFVIRNYQRKFGRSAERKVVENFLSDMFTGYPFEEYFKGPNFINV